MIRWELPQPAGRNAAAARFLFGVGDGFLVVLDLFLETIELVERCLALGGDLRTLRRVVAVDEIGRQRVDPALQGLGVDLIALERFAKAGHPLRPVALTLLLA